MWQSNIDLGDSRFKQVLPMLSASGVIRPSHVEPERFDRTTRLSATARQLSRPKAISSAPTALSTHQILESATAQVFW